MEQKRIPVRTRVLNVATAAAAIGLTVLRIRLYRHGQIGFVDLLIIAICSNTVIAGLIDLASDLYD